MKKRVLLGIIFLLLIPFIISIYLGYSKQQKSNGDIVIYEINNAEKIDVSKIDNKAATGTYISIFTLLALTGLIFMYAEKKKS